MKRLFGLCAVVIVAVILVIGLSDSTSSVEAQGGKREVEVKRVNMSTGQATTHTLGVPVGISCLEMSTGVECYVVSTR